MRFSKNVYRQVSHGHGIYDLIHLTYEIELTYLSHLNRVYFTSALKGVRCEYQRGEAGYHVRNLLREMAGLPFCRRVEVLVRGLHTYEIELTYLSHLNRVYFTSALKGVRCDIEGILARHRCVSSRRCIPRAWVKLVRTISTVDFKAVPLWNGSNPLGMHLRLDTSHLRDRIDLSFPFKQGLFHFGSQRSRF
jgi:hypothetical protein